MSCKAHILYLYEIILPLKMFCGGDFSSGAAVKNPPASAGDTGSLRDPGRSHMPRSS